jgi:hypothetical protein
LLIKYHLHARIQVLRIKEDTAVYAVDWHPAHSCILASGRSSRTHAVGKVKVWDTSISSAADPQPIAAIHTADGVSNIMWRPTYRTQLATSYMTHIHAVHVWDLPQNWTPLAVCAQHTQPATDILWHDAVSPMPLMPSLAPTTNPPLYPSAPSLLPAPPHETLSGRSVRP